MANSAFTPLALGVGQEVAYEERTSNFTTTATTEGTAAVVVTADAFVADGASAYLIEFYAPRWFGSAANAQCNLIIHDGTNSLGFFYMGTLATTAEVMGVCAQRRLVPTAGSKTYSIRAYTGAATTLTISAGSGGAAAFVPAFVRITKVT